MRRASEFGPNDDQSPSLTARSLGKRYGKGGPALQAIDLDVRPGGITALVGPNGSGKSTLMKAWVGFERPTSGEVSVAGIDPWRRGGRPRALEHIGYVPQEVSLYRELTAEQHFVLARGLRRQFDSSIARQRLDELGVDADTRIGDLSGGQQAQVSLALALAAGGEILILDEPLASLDPLARREFLHLLREQVADGGLTAVLSSHVVTDVEQACDHIVVLADGRKVLDAPIRAALAEHVISMGSVDETDKEAVKVASFLGPDGETLTLLRVPDGGQAHAGARPASIEEMVLGYLATGRRSRVNRQPTSGPTGGN